jgi:hypothetical protein
MGEQSNSDNLLMAKAEIHRLWQALDKSVDNNNVLRVQVAELERENHRLRMVIYEYEQKDSQTAS